MRRQGGKLDCRSAKVVNSIDAALHWSSYPTGFFWADEQLQPPGEDLEVVKKAMCRCMHCSVENAAVSYENLRERLRQR